MQCGASSAQSMRQDLLTGKTSGFEDLPVNDSPRLRTGHFELRKRNRLFLLISIISADLSHIHAKTRLICS